MAKTIYDYWFTQFDFPDENGKPYRSSGGQMVWNEQVKREIPVDWEVKTLSQIMQKNAKPFDYLSVQAAVDAVKFHFYYTTQFKQKLYNQSL